MAWSWSHSDVAYDAARNNLARKSRKWLLTCLREFNYYELDNAGKRPHFRLPYNGRKVAKDVLVAEVWEKAEELRLCSNGGHELYMCPDGCHCVSVDVEK